MKTLSHPEDAAELRNRVLSLMPSDAPAWGVMIVNQMICHVREAYVYALMDTPVELIPLAYPPHIVKKFALTSSAPWPQSSITIPQLKVDAPGMACIGFDQDRETLLTAFDQFCSLTHYTRDHPFFGSMQHEDWMRWGYLHTDHHLRQFGR
jgi:hypothetical protein